MKKMVILIFLIITGLVLQAQHDQYVIQLANKNGSPYSINTPSAFLSAKAIERRTRQHIKIDSTDLPVSAAYLQSIGNIQHVKILYASKWFNQVLIQSNDAAAIASINSLPFVQNTVQVKSRARISSFFDFNPKYSEERFDPVKETLISSARTTATTVLSYGNTFNQVHIHEGEYLHNLGFTGEGITIAILDAGFKNYKTNPAFDSVRLQGRVLGERDFVTNDGSVNEDDAHGASCFSIIASNRPGKIVGSAPYARFWLLRTENSAGEYPIELQNWAVAAEFADSAGVDMISSSLGYADGFTDAANDIQYAQRDGNTSIVTIAADLAAKKGILVVNSAGNNGNLTDDFKFVSCPADGDSVLTVGATDVNGNIASFSSWGPNGAGKLKPNVVSVGQGTVLALSTGEPATGNGTSFACPNLAGLIACLWQAFPEFTNMEIFDAVQKSAGKYTNPDNRFGYGIPNFHKAYDWLQEERNNRNIASNSGNQWIKAYPIPFTGSIHLVIKAPVTGKGVFRLTDFMGSLVANKTLDMTADQVYSVDFAIGGYQPKGVYYILYNDGKNKQTIPVLRR